MVFKYWVSKVSREYSVYPSILPIWKQIWTIQVYIDMYSILFLTYIPFFLLLKDYLYQLPNLLGIARQSPLIGLLSPPPPPLAGIWTENPLSKVLWLFYLESFPNVIHLIVALLSEFLNVVILGSRIPNFSSRKSRYF